MTNSIEENEQIKTQPKPAISENKDKKPKKSKWEDLLVTAGIIVLAPLVALFLINFVFQSYEVDGPSMESTLQDQDRLIVSKTGKTWSRITGDAYIPKRYEIVIFSYSGELDSPGKHVEKSLIKRVIGLPGDRVLVKNGVVTIFNDEHPTGYLVDQFGPENETVTITNKDVDITVQKDHVFVMGDNRGNSLDSRFFGAVKSEDLIGKLELRVYPFNKSKKF